MKDLLEKIKEHEGFREKTYKCTEGYDTTAYGFAWKDLYLSEDMANELLQRNKNNIVFYEDIAEDVLIEKLEKLKRNAISRFKWLEDMPQEVQEVVINMCYQLGVTGVSKFRKAISALQEGEWNEAADEMLDSLWAKQTPNRATELSNIVRNQVEKIGS
tara:strand:+ start:1519 stop:1995 length:477 start_codon:yes stop_codon:yes gene_type:complete